MEVKKLRNHLTKVQNHHSKTFIKGQIFQKLMIIDMINFGYMNYKNIIKILYFNKVLQT
jgi:hypothetical protein